MDVNQKDLVFRINAGTVAKIVVVLALFVAAYFLRDLILVVLMSVVIASSIEPAIKKFKSWGISRLPSVIIVYAVVAITLLGVFYFLFVPLLAETSTFLNDLPGYVSNISLWNPLPVSSLSTTSPLFSNFSNAFSLSNIVSHFNATVAGFSTGLVGTLSAVFGGLLSFVLMVVLSFYLAVQEDGIALFLKTISPLKHRQYIIGLWRRAENKIALWMQGQLVLAVIIAVLSFLGLTLLGVRHALLLAVLAGLFEVIPVFGPILSAIPAVALAFMDQGFVIALVVVGLYIIIQQFENHLIYPLVVRKVVGVSPIVVILSLIVGAKLAGFLGILLAVPLATILMEFLNDLQKEALLQEKGQEAQK